MWNVTVTLKITEMCALSKVLEIKMLGLAQL